MDLDTITSRIAEGISSVDKSTKSLRANARTGEIYLPGAKTLTEVELVRELTAWWHACYPNDFRPDSDIVVEYPYPNLSRANCDLVFTSDTHSSDEPEWAIEIKHIALVGNNGKNNDYGVGKTLSPYLKDRSLIHDIDRLRKNRIAPRRAVIMYGFEYSFDSCDQAGMRHPDSASIISEVRRVCRSVDQIDGRYTLEPLIRFANEIFVSNGLTKSTAVTAEFLNAWRHPCGGNGTVAAWEVP